LIIYGINPVLEALRAGRVRELHVGPRGGERIAQLLAVATQHGVRVTRVLPDVLERESRHGVHQGVVARVDEPAQYSVQDLLAVGEGTPLIVVLDGIEDPHNVGAILRTADAAGVHGVVMQSRRAAALGGVAAKAAAGAISHVRIAEVVNIARAVEDLKDANVWTIGLAIEGSQPYNAIDYTVPSAIVLGAEGAGLRRLVRDRCDHLASIPMYGHVDSLNVSVAAGVVLFEAVRQRASRKV
jgi:23S rRNA (guanosine2251-2'-O)-methyltransferase